MSPREALDRISALCDEADPDPGEFTLSPGGVPWVQVDEVRAVLAEVSPDYAAVNRSLLRRLQAAGGVLDRDQARDRLWAIFEDEDVWDEGYGHVIERVLDALAGCVRPAAIDRDALRAAIAGPVQGLGDEPWEAERDEAIDAATQAVLVLVGAAS